MATLPTNEDHARTVLTILARHHLRVGEVLQPNSLVAAQTKGVRGSDIQAGLDHGATAGWFEVGPRMTVKLTQAGFDEQVSMGLAKVLSAEDKGRSVLAIFAQRKVRAGEGLQPNVLMASTNNDFRWIDVQDGLAYGAEAGWFEDGPNGSIRLTEAGFAAMP